MLAQNAITMTTGAVTTSTDGDILYKSETGDIQIETITTGSENNGASVAIEATLGAITDLNETAVDITTEHLLLIAGEPLKSVSSKQLRSDSVLATMISFCEF